MNYVFKHFFLIYQNRRVYSNLVFYGNFFFLSTLIGSWTENQKKKIFFRRQVTHMMVQSCINPVLFIFIKMLLTRKLNYYSFFIFSILVSRRYQRVLSIFHSSANFEAIKRQILIVEKTIQCYVFFNIFLQFLSLIKLNW